MLKAKLKKGNVIIIPKKLGKILKIKDGDEIEAKLENEHLVLLKKNRVLPNLLQYAGVWENEDVDKIFYDIRKKWREWIKNLPAFL